MCVGVDILVVVLVLSLIYTVRGFSKEHGKTLEEKKGRGGRQGKGPSVVRRTTAISNQT